MTQRELYEQDEHQWLVEVAQAIATGGEFDPLVVRDYMLDMATRDRRELRQRLTLLLRHLLKWEFQPDKQSKSWQSTIRIQRREITRMIEEMPSLRRLAEGLLAKAYADSREDAATETGLDLSAFPAELRRTLDEVLECPVENWKAGD
jgi:hypothetical protein